MKPPENVRATRRLKKEEEKWTPIEIDIWRRLQTRRAFFLPSLSEITPAVIRPNILAGWFRLTGKYIQNELLKEGRQGRDVLMVAGGSKD